MLKDPEPLHDTDPSMDCHGRGRMRGIVKPWLLLLLRKRSAHGYLLLKQLEDLEPAPDVDTAFLYRTLHRFEEEGLVRSAWQDGGPGPDRRVYHLTPEGAGALRRWSNRIRSTRALMDRFLHLYEEGIQGLGSGTPEGEEAG